jgi:adenylylsulfate kinase
LGYGGFKKLARDLLMSYKLIEIGDGMEKKLAISQQYYRISKEMRQEQSGHKSCVIWFTGLSGSGKSTLADALDNYLYENGLKSYVLDGDNIRLGLNNNLGFSPTDRKENIRRVGEVARLFVDAGVISIAAFISPYIEDRNNVRALFKKGEFIEVYVKCPLEVCENRDPKGLYKKARSGEIKEFTGISSPYEESVEPDIVIETDLLSISESIQNVIRYLVDKKIVEGN